MLYFKKINLQSAEAIKKFAIDEITSKIKTADSLYQQKIFHTFPTDLENLINSELETFNIPPISYAVSYIRPKNSFQGIHIDGVKEKIISSAINIPLKGCENSFQIWYKGNYSTNLISVPGNTYHNIIWKDGPVEDARLQVDQPYMVRVDKPHSALSGNTERWVITIRFKTNPQFDDLIKNIP